MVFVWLGVLSAAGALQQSPYLEKLYMMAYVERAPDSTHEDTLGRTERIQAIRKFGAVGTRVVFEWGRIQPSSRVFDWGHVDSVMNALHGAGVRAYGLLTYSAPWARQLGAPPVERPTVGGSSARGDTAFAQFAAAAARRYRGRVEGWEIWNEPNLPMFWVHIVAGRNAGPDPKDYWSLYSLAEDSIHAADPGVAVVTGGLASRQGLVRVAPDPEEAGRALLVLPAHVFLRELLRLGARPLNVGLHPYSRTPPGVKRLGSRTPAFPDMVLDSVLDVLDAYEMKATHVWVTEWGVKQAWANSPSALRSWYSVALQRLLCDSRIPVVTIYELTPTGGAENQGFALLDDFGHITPSGTAFEEALGRFSCPQVPESGSTPGPNDLGARAAQWAHR